MYVSVRDVVRAGGHTYTVKNKIITRQLPDDKVTVRKNNKLITWEKTKK